MTPARRQTSFGRLRTGFAGFTLSEAAGLRVTGGVALSLALLMNLSAISDIMFA